MSHENYKLLSEAQVQSFLDKGYLVVKGCVDPALAKSWTDEAFERLSYDKHDPESWKETLVWMNRNNTLPVKEISTRAWQAICDVVGGEERLETTTMEIESTHFTTINTFEWSDAFVANFKHGADEPWRAPAQQALRWHKDGSYFRHFLDSREQALLTIVYWSDVAHQGGGTFISPDSVRVVARYLADHPEGVAPEDLPFDELIAQCHEFEEVTGDLGDFIILHPFMLHTWSQNALKIPRFLTNPPIVLKEPMNLNRDDADQFSLLEKATLHYLGLDKLDFRPKAPRESHWWVAGSK